MTEKENEYCNGTRKIVVEIAEKTASETRIPRVYKRFSACEPVIQLCEQRTVLMIKVHLRIVISPYGIRLKQK